jgi:protoheme IX farnesyltransferase
MKTVAIPLTRPRLADYAELARPRIAVMVLVTVAAGAILAGGVAVSPLLLLHAVLGTALVASGASALNQWLERDSDACMARTARRPLPAGRLSPGEVFAFGMLLGVGGFLYLLFAIPTPGAALVAAISFVGYVGIYTPLKSRTILNTWIGAVPGALPPVIGFVAVRGELTADAWALFAILFLWQIPHFLAIAWMYRDQYAAAGLRMLPGEDHTGKLTGWNMIVWCGLLIVASVWPFLLGHAGLFYLAAALLLGGVFLRSTAVFLGKCDRPAARNVLLVSLVYLPGLLVAWVVDRGLLWVVS